MPRKSTSKIYLTVYEEERLQEMERKYTLPNFQIIRAKIILLAAQGLDNNLIALAKLLVSGENVFRLPLGWP